MKFIQNESINNPHPLRGMPLGGVYFVCTSRKLPLLWKAFRSGKAANSLWGVRQKFVSIYLTAESIGRILSIYGDYRIINRINFLDFSLELFA